MTSEFVRDRLFRPFQSTKPAGMGIGAYESAQYVRDLGGRIEVESEPGRGTRIRVILPERASDTRGDREAA
jgi:signal transduction histidine kinase